MKTSDIIHLRLRNQLITKSNFKTPQEVVAYMGALQAQEYGQSKWAIGLRLPGATDESIEQAFTQGSILRTHLLRPTWHFVAPADIRWMLSLTAPHVHAFNATYYRKSGLDAKVFSRSIDQIAKTLEGGKHLNRSALQAALAQCGIEAEGLRLSLLMMYAELEAVICSGPRHGKQFTYALMDERVPATPPMNRDEALATLTARYFASRGPATLQDFAWWSGLAMKEIRKAVDALPAHFERQKTGGKEYIFAATGTPIEPSRRNVTFLMSDYDEYGISYKDRSAIFPPSGSAKAKNAGRAVYNHMMIINGVIGGTWRSAVKNKKTDVETSAFAPLSQSKEKAVAQAVKKYLKFFNTPGRPAPEKK